MGWILIWEAGGRLRSHGLGVGSYYLGRPLAEDIARGATNPLGVYIIPAEPPGEPVDTGISPAPTVSRRHVKLVVEPDGVTVVDHGPRGEGAMNPTYVNGASLPRGGSMRILPGSQAEVKLSTSGPTFILAPQQAGGHVTISLEPEVPAELPASIARLLEREGVTSEVAGGGDTSLVVVPRPITLILPGPGPLQVKVESADRPAGQSLQPPRERVLLRLAGLLDQIEDLVRGGYGAERVQVLEKQLRLKVFEDTFKKLGSQAYQDYKTLLALLREYGASDTALRLVRSLKQMVFNHP